MKKTLPQENFDGKWFELWYRSYKKLRVPSNDLYEIVTLTNFESRTIDNLFGNRMVSTLSQVKLII